MLKIIIIRYFKHKSVFWNLIKIFFILIFIFPKIIFAQKNVITNDIHLRANYQYGLLLPEYDFFYYLVNDNIKSVEFDIYKELTGRYLWQRLYKYPSIGMAFTYSSLGNNDVFGNVFAINPYIKFNVLAKRKFKIEYIIGSGLSYASKHFDLINNYQNIAIASHLNIWFNTELTASYQAYKNVSFFAGTSFNHLSNANLSEPNIGLNTWNFMLGTDVLIGNNSEKYYEAIPKFEKKNQYAVIFAGGSKHTRRFARNSYFAGSVSFEYKRMMAHKFSLGTGADLFYDASIPDEMIKAEISDVKNQYKFKSGIHLSQEFIFGRVSLILQEGIYIFLQDKLDNNIMYNRGILRYKFSDKFFVNLSMKSNVIVLDVMEIGFGYYWN